MKKMFAGLSLALFVLIPQAQASPWAKNSGYFGKTAGKLAFGLKHILLGWTAPWLEANEPKYKREWEGFCAGMGKGIVYEGAGLIQTVTFPIPIDFPDIGQGLHLPKHATASQKQPVTPRKN